MKRKSAEEIANQIANDIIAGHSQYKSIFHDNIWHRIRSAVGTETRKADLRHAVSDLVYNKVRAAGIRVHS